MRKPTPPQALLCFVILLSTPCRSVCGFSPPWRITPIANRDASPLQAATLDGGMFFNGNPNYASTSPIQEPQESKRRKVLTATIASYLTFLLQKLITWDTLGMNADYSVVEASKYSPTTLTVGTVSAFLSLLAAIKMIMTSSLLSFSAVASWYLHKLEAAPLLTKCITGGLIAFCGDYGAQWFEFRSKSHTNDDRIQDDTNDTMSPSVTLSSPGRAGHQQPPQSSRLSIHGTYNFRRGMARFLECLLISSPLMHYGYDLFERIVPTTSSSVGTSGLYSCLAALSHVIADSVFLDGIFVMTGIIATGLFEGLPLKRLWPNLRNVYVPTLKASVVTSSALMPLQFLSFRFLPVQLRVLSVNAVDLIWTGVVSFVSHSDVRSDGMNG